MEFDPTNLGDPAHVLEIRATGGSREQLLLAAYDLLEGIPEFAVRRRSHVWTIPAVDDSPGYVSLGVRVHTAAPVSDVIDRARAIESMLHSDEALPAHERRVAIDLLWSSAAQGEVAGRTLPDPALATRASAVTIVWEVASGITDAYGQPIERFLDTAPPPYPERARGVPLVPRHQVRVDDDDDRHVTSWGRDRADLLAQAGTVLGAVVGPAGEVRASEVVDIDVMVPADDDDERLLRWLRAVADVLENFPFRTTRVVVFDDAADHVSGAVLGVTARGERPPVVTTADARIEPDPGPLPLRAAFRLRSR
jgi:7,8-dihydro-6-hydroxymethylpterin-pyrophosphokinase